MPEQEIQLCECGCGQPAPLAPYTNRQRGYIKGQPMRFVHNHHKRGRHTNGWVIVPIAERFWRHVTAGPFDECWIWQAWKNNKGYGQIGGTDGRLVLAHRVSWEIHNGPIPKGTKVLHECDNPACVNPHHLWLGTQADNMADMRQKGRENRTSRSRGESNGFAKLTEDQVRAIRALSAEGIFQREIAKRFGISQIHVSYIVRRKSWKHVP